jgi:hypothetical protein
MEDYDDDRTTEQEYDDDGTTEQEYDELEVDNHPYRNVFSRYLPLYAYNEGNRASIQHTSDKGKRKSASTAP